MQSPLCTSALKSLWLNSAVLSQRIDLILADVHGISFAEYMVLDKLAMTSNKAMSRLALATAMGKSVSSIVRMLKPMEKIGLIDRRANLDDARGTLVGLTKSGEKLLRQVGSRLDHNAELQLNGLDNSQLGSLLALLGKI